jgi:hypothetical protein
VGLDHYNSCFRSCCGADFLHHPAGLSRCLGSWLLHLISNRSAAKVRLLDHAQLLMMLSRRALLRQFSGTVLGAGVSGPLLSWATNTPAVSVTGRRG